MPAPTVNPNLRSKLGAFGPWIAIGVVATLAGLVLPQMLPGETVVAKAAKTETRDKGSLHYTAPTLPEPPNFQAMMFRLGAGTVLVLGLCVASLWAMRRWLSPAASLVAGERALRLMETLPLGNRCCLHLVRLGQREILVGVDSAGIKSVLPLAEPFEQVLAQAETMPLTEELTDAPRLAA